MENRLETHYSRIRDQMKKQLSQRNYPCVAALQSFFKHEYEMGVYSDFGSGRASPRLADDLSRFQKKVRETKSPYLSFFACFPESPQMSEEEFESGLFQELSFLAADPRYSQTWDPRFSSNPDDPNFCFSFNGEGFFVVGLFPNSSRRSRRFETPTLVFNSFLQFDILKSTNAYADMVKINRERDKLFDGGPNPMAVLYSDQRQAIQFSGRNNSAEWKCPFSRLMNLFKRGG